MRQKKTHKKHQFLNRSGQGMVEYILLIVVIVVIVATLVQVFVKPVGKYVDEITGTYLQCLLLTGELPNNAKNCPFPVFKGGGSASGSNSTNGGSNGSKGGGDNNSDKSDGSNSKVDKDGSKDASSSGGGGGSSESVGPGGARAGSTFAGSRSRKKGFGVKGGSPNADVSSNSEGAQTRQSLSSSERMNYGAPRTTVRVVKVVGISGALFDENGARKRSKVTAPAGQVAPKVAGSGGSGVVKTMPFKTPPMSKKSAEVEMETSLGIGGIFRTILIFSIIVIVIFLIGGQITQIFRSMEKGD